MFHSSKPSSPSSSSRRRFGNEGEQLTVHWLINHGYTILERNYQKSCGEIDIITRKNEIIAFIEVKTRKTAHFDLSQVITPSKQRKIIKTAQLYIMHNQLIDHVFRFDVALVEGSGPESVIKYIPNAFTQVDDFQ